MRLIDTHVHLYASEYDSDRESVTEAARKVGVERLLLPNIDLDSYRGMMDLVAAHPDLCYPMIGLHPCYVDSNYTEQLSFVEAELQKGGYIGIGEIGMDRHWSLEHIVQQEDALRIQLKWAVHYDLPVALHTRNANDEVIAIIRDLDLSGLRGVFHCFSGSVKQAQQMIDLGFVLGIGGVVTYKNAGIAEVLAEIPVEHLVLETDGPYLAPVPHRGKRNAPSYLIHIAEKLAEIKGMPVEELAEITSINASKLFRL